MNEGEVSIQEGVREPERGVVENYIIQTSRNSRVPASTLIVRVTEVIDADPEREQRIFASPWGACGLACNGSEKLVHLVCHREDRRLEWCDKVRVDGRTAVREVISERQRLVEFYSGSVDPVHSTNSGPSL